MLLLYLLPIQAAHPVSIASCGIEVPRWLEYEQKYIHFIKGRSMCIVLGHSADTQLDCGQLPSACATCTQQAHIVR